ncbi:MAG: DNA repair protein RecO [Alkalispirochaeta sp.]
MNVNRSSQHVALVLRLSPFGESHAMVDLLVPEEGVVPAVAYGLRSRRSSLRGKIVPFARGQVWLYRDPRQDRSKITDFDVERYALELQNNLTAFYHANLWAELIWRTHAAGDAGTAAFELLSEGLDLIQQPGPAADARARQIGLGVLWRYLSILGVQPELDYCVASERPFQPRESRYYQPGDGGLVTAEWAGPATLQLPPQGAAFLRAANERGLAILTARILEPEIVSRVRAVVLAAIQDAVEAELNTVRVAGGLL